jgi:hypothetical protein
LKTNSSYAFPGSYFTLNYSAGTNGSITENDVQTVFYGGDSRPVEAIPEPGFRFVTWSDGVIDNPRTDIGIVGEINVTALFEQNTNNENITNKSSTKAYPNPFSDVLFVRSINDVSTVRIYDSRGRVMSNIQVYKQDRSIQINTSQMANGVYLLNILYQNGEYDLKKLTKK